jgi:hypothetical protein
MALPTIDAAFVVGVFALAYGEFGLLVLLASAGLATALPAIASAVSGERARTAGRAPAGGRRWVIVRAGTRHDHRSARC